jgi:hypothetical protein
LIEVRRGRYNTDAEAQFIYSILSSWPAWPVPVTFSPKWRPISYGLLALLDEVGAQPHLRMVGSVITLLRVLLWHFLV